MINCVVFVGPNVGLAQISNLKSFLVSIMVIANAFGIFCIFIYKRMFLLLFSQMDQLADFREIDGLVITPHTDGKQNVKLFLTNGKVLVVKFRKS